MSVLIKGMEMPKHVSVNGEKDTAYKCVILAHPDNSVELVVWQNRIFNPRRSRAGIEGA